MNWGCGDIRLNRITIQKQLADFSEDVETQFSEILSKCIYCSLVAATTVMTPAAKMRMCNARLMIRVHSGTVILSSEAQFGTV